MDWKAANEQQDEARWSVFLMFVAMALMIIRTGLVSRGLISVLCTRNGAHDAAPTMNHQPPTTSPTDLSQATLVLLCLAEAAGQLIITMTREVWELTNQPLPQPPPAPPFNVASLCEHPAQRLDTS